MTNRGQLSLGLASVVLLFSPLHGPQVHELQVGNEIGCPACRLERELVVTLGDGGDKPLCSPLARVAMSGDFFFVGPTCQAGEVNIYDLEGTLQGVRGGHGEGPGEFLSVNAVWATRAGLLYVAGAPRHTIYLRDGTIAAEFPSPGTPHDLLLFDDGSSIQQRVDRSSDRVGLPVHVVDPRGKLVSSFGAHSAAFRPDRLVDTLRVLARAADETVWLGRLQPYVLEEWTVDGVHRVSITRDLREVTGGDEYEVQGLREGADGSLWVLLSVVNTVLLGATPTPEFSATSVNALLDTIVEIIDPSVGQVLARRRFQTLMPRWLGQEGLTHSYRVTEADELVVDIWRVHVERASPLH